MIFSNVKNISIPEGSVSKITDALGRVLWAVSSTPGTDEPGYSGNTSAFPTMAENNTWYKSSVDKATITKIEFKNSYSPTSSIDETWNADVGNSGSIKCYRIGTTIVIAGNGSGGIKANTNSKKLFMNMSKLQKIVGLPYLYTRNVYYMTDMFQGCLALTSINVSNFDTRNVREMSSMFASCKAITSLDVSNFDTSNVYYMTSMFSSCSSLTELDVSNFDTSQVESMAFMFDSCKKLASLDVSNFDTNKVADMRYMFSDLISLTSLNVSNFDTTNVEDMGGMFQNCEKLTSLSLSNFNTSKVEDMEFMFYGCKRITSLNLTSFTITTTTAIDGMFQNCSNLKTIKVSKTNWNMFMYANDVFTGCGTNTLTYI